MFDEIRAKNFSIAHAKQKIIKPRKMLFHKYRKISLPAWEYAPRSQVKRIRAPKQAHAFLLRSSWSFAAAENRTRVRISSQVRASERGRWRSKELHICYETTASFPVEDVIRLRDRIETFAHKQRDPSHAHQRPSRLLSRSLLFIRLRATFCLLCINYRDNNQRRNCA